MGEKSYFQCQNCGTTSRKKIKFNKEEMYITVPCPRCRGETKHLWVGSKPEDVYLYGNSNLDARYYEYNTK